MTAFTLPDRPVCPDCHAPLPGPCHCGVRGELLRLADFMVEDVMATSDEELLAEECEDAADDLWLAAAYLKENLDAGKPIYESKWLGAVVEAHRLLEALGKRLPAAEKTD